MVKNYIVKVDFDGVEYELLFTTAALKIISEKFGGLDKIADAFRTDDSSKALEKLEEIFVILENQASLHHNKRNSAYRRELLSLEQLQIMSDTLPLNFYMKCLQDGILGSFNKGTEREVKSEDAENSKNA